LSLAGVRSNRGDHYQTLIAFDWALSILADETYQWLEVDSTALDASGKFISVDDVVIGGAGTLPMMLFISVAFGKMSAKLRGFMLKSAAFIMMFMGLNTLHKGLTFYLDEDFKHSTFLSWVKNMLDAFDVFIGQTMDYIAGMIEVIQSM
jgi:hypothetical protein